MFAIEKITPLSSTKYIVTGWHVSENSGDQFSLQLPMTGSSVVDVEIFKFQRKDITELSKNKFGPNGSGFAFAGLASINDLKEFSKKIIVKDGDSMEVLSFNVTLMKSFNELLVYIIWLVGDDEVLYRRFVAEFVSKIILDIKNGCRSVYKSEKKTLIKDKPGVEHNRIFAFNCSQSVETLITQLATIPLKSHVVLGRFEYSEAQTIEKIHSIALSNAHKIEFVRGDVLNVDFSDVNSIIYMNSEVFIHPNDWLIYLNANDPILLGAKLSSEMDLGSENTHGLKVIALKITSGMFSLFKKEVPFHFDSRIFWGRSVNFLMEKNNWPGIASSASYYLTDRYFDVERLRLDSTDARLVYLETLRGFN